MDERKFLDKIRNLQKKGEKISLTEFEDLNKKKDVGPRLLINEADESDIQNLDPDEQREEENKFKDIVSKLVKFNKIKVHQQNVEWSGQLVREKIDWVYSLDDTVGCYIDTTEFIQLHDDVLEVLKKLRGYYDVWSDEWSSRLTGTPTEDEGDEMDVDFGTEEGGEAPEGGETPNFEF